VNIVNYELALLFIRDT